MTDYLVEYSSGPADECGPVGAGDATKSINNVLNSAHLLLATEGMLALKKYGVEPSTALEAINGGSGMSLQTTRLPDNVLSRKFNFGFALGLMRKDCNIAGALVGSQTPSATLIPRVVELLGRLVRGGLVRVVRRRGDPPVAVEHR